MKFYLYKNDYNDKFAEKNFIFEIKGFEANIAVPFRHNGEVYLPICIGFNKGKKDKAVVERIAKCQKRDIMEV